ncbi:MAG TPA: flippase [Solirubrobacterales bacterium]|nr:flippase [Solirubrobacterales bacterium]
MSAGRLGSAAEWATAAAICALAGLAVATLAPHVGSDLLPGLLVWIVAISLAVVARRTLRGRSFVGLVLVYGFLSIGGIAALLYSPTERELGGVNGSLAQMAQVTPGYVYLGAFLVAAAAAWLGTMAVSGRLPRAATMTAGKALSLPGWLLPVAAVPLFAYVFGVGAATILHADRYLEHNGPVGALKIGQTTGPIGVLLCGYFLFKPGETGGRRAGAFILALAYEAVYLGYASRAFALWVPLMLAGGILANAWDAKGRRRAGAVALILTVLALQITLSVRSERERGLIPALDFIGGNPTKVVSPQGQALNNIVVGAPLTVYVAHHVGALPIGDLKTEANPLPAGTTNWADLSKQLRLNEHVPYSALGELLNHGWAVYAIAIFVFSIGFAVAERIARTMRGTLSSLAYVVVLGTAALFVVQSTEYPLRTSSRLLYAALGAMALLWLGDALIRRAERPRTSHVARGIVPVMAAASPGIFPPRLSLPRPALPGPIGRLAEFASGTEGDLRTLVRGAGIAFVLQVLGAGLAFLLQILLGRWLGASGFGLYNLTISWAGLVAVVVGLGLPTTLVRFLPDYLAHEQWDRMHGLLRMSVVVTAGAAVGIAALVTAAVAVARAAGSTIGPDVLLGIWLVPGLALIELQREAIRAYHRIGLAYSPNQVFRPALIILAGVLYVRIDGTLTSSEALLATIAVTCFVLLIQAALFWRKLPVQARIATPTYEVRTWMKVALPLLLVASFVIILSQTDIVMVGLIAGSHEAGLYSAASKIAALVGLVLLAANAIAAPMFSSFFAQGMHERLQRLATRVAHGVFWPSLAISLFLGILARPLLGLFGAQFPAAQWDLIVLLIGELVNAAAGSVGYLMIVTGYQGEAAKVYGWVAALHIALNVVGILLFGALGAAIATTISFCIWNIWLNALVVRRLDVHASIFSRPRWRTRPGG